MNNIFLIHLIAFSVLIAFAICIILLIVLSKRRMKSIQQNYDTKRVYDTLIQSTPIPLVVIRDRKIIYINQSCLDLLGFSKEEIINKSLFHFVNEDSHEDTMKRISEGYHKNPVFNQVLLDKEGKKIDVKITAIPTQYEGEDAVQMLIQDVREKRKNADKIKQLAYYDSLTKLPNRTFFSEKAKELLSTVREDNYLGVLLLDLDDFKKINDNFGHSAGDNLLIHIADVISKSTNGEAVLSRLSGDEFGILIPNIKERSEIKQVISTIKQYLSEPWRIENYCFNNTVSMGVFLIEDPNIEVEEILKSADMALSKAKEQGKNTHIFYSKEMQENLLNKLKIEHELRNAIKNKEIEIYYQPKINSFTGETVGLEALVRWNKPGEGMISPFFFIPIAEETGLILPLGELIFDEVCYQIKKWKEEGYQKTRIAINLSLIQFEQVNFLDFVKETIKEHQIEADWLEIEITESVFMDNLERTTRILKEMQDMGIYIAIDDFGTGYSSLTYLKSLPIDKLKIDKSFVMDLDQGNLDSAIVKTIISLAQNLKKGVIAEGVETNEQLELLKKYECEEVQGYLFSKPVTSQEVVSFLKR